MRPTPVAAVVQARPDPGDSMVRQRSSPLVRKIAKEHNVDISQIHGTGIAGRVTKDDILGYIEKGQVGRVGLVGRVGQAGQVEQAGQVGRVGQVGQAGKSGPAPAAPQARPAPAAELAPGFVAGGGDWAAVPSDDGAAVDLAGCGVLPIYARMSSFVTRPEMPVPWIWLISTLCSLAIFLTSGDERNARSASAGAVAGPGAVTAAGAVTVAG